MAQAIGQFETWHCVCGQCLGIALIKISLLAWDNNLPSHPCSFFHTFYFMLSKISFFFWPMKDGRSKYFSYSWTTGTLRAALIVFCKAWEVDLLKKIVVFSLFIYCPDTFSYVAKTSNSFWHSFSFALQNIRLSFAKRRWVSLGSFRQIETPLISPIVSDFLITHESLLYITKINMGRGGHLVDDL